MAQDTSKAYSFIKKTIKENVKVSGGFSANAAYYTAVGIENRRPPFYWLINGNITITAGQVSIPVYVTFSEQQNRLYTNPFNQFGLSPKYKSITVHAGYRSMQFSEFTLAGNVFLGGGIEVAPKTSPFRFSAMYGRFARAISEIGTESYTLGQPAYERWGYGAKCGYQAQQGLYEFSVFRAADRTETISDTTAQQLNLKPQENLVWGIKAKQKILKRWLLSVDYALSAFTRDRRDEERTMQSYRYANYLKPFYETRSSSQFNKAIVANITYQASVLQASLNYRRIDPEYKTLGSTFLTNDMEDITAGLGWKMLKNKINIMTNAGLQRNNLNNQKQAAMLRKVFNINLNYLITPKLNLNTQFANYNTTTQTTRFTNSGIAGNTIDSLFYLQVNRSIGANLSYNFQRPLTNQSILLNNNYQTASNTQKNNSSFYISNVAHTITWSASSLSLTTSWNVTRSIFPTKKVTNTGPTITISKQLFHKKVKVLGSFNTLLGFQEGIKASQVYNTRASLAWSPINKHTFVCDAFYLVSQSVLLASTRNFSEIRTGVTYNYSF